MTESNIDGLLGDGESQVYLKFAMGSSPDDLDNLGETFKVETMTFSSLNNDQTRLLATFVLVETPGDTDARD